MKKFLVYMMLAVCVAAPAVTRADSLKVWPDQFVVQCEHVVPQNDTWRVFQTPGGMAHTVYPSAGDSSWAVAPVVIPVGKTITNIVYYHKASGLKRLTQLWFYRVRMGFTEELLASANCSAEADGYMTVKASLFGDMVIRAGYRYYLMSDCGLTASFGGVKILYK